MAERKENQRCESVEDVVAGAAQGEEKEEDTSHGQNTEGDRTRGAETFDSDNMDSSDLGTGRNRPREDSGRSASRQNTATQEAENRQNRTDAVSFLRQRTGARMLGSGTESSSLTDTPPSLAIPTFPGAYTLRLPVANTTVGYPLRRAFGSTSLRELCTGASPRRHRASPSSSTLSRMQPIPESRVSEDNTLNEDDEPMRVYDSSGNLTHLYHVDRQDGAPFLEEVFAPRRTVPVSPTRLRNALLEPEETINPIASTSVSSRLPVAPTNPRTGLSGRFTSTTLTRLSRRRNSDGTILSRLTAEQRHRRNLLEHLSRSARNRRGFPSIGSVLADTNSPSSAARIEQARREIASIPIGVRSAPRRASTPAAGPTTSRPVRDIVSALNASQATITGSAPASGSSLGGSNTTSGSNPAVTTPSQNTLSTRSRAPSTSLSSPLATPTSPVTSSSGQINRLSQSSWRRTGEPSNRRHKIDLSDPIGLTLAPVPAVYAHAAVPLNQMPPGNPVPPAVADSVAQTAPANAVAQTTPANQDVQTALTNSIAPAIPVSPDNTISPASTVAPANPAITSNPTVAANLPIPVAIPANTANATILANLFVPMPPVNQRRPRRPMPPPPPALSPLVQLDARMRLVDPNYRAAALAAEASQARRRRSQTLETPTRTHTANRQSRQHQSMTMPSTRGHRTEASDQTFEIDTPTRTRSRRSEASAQTFDLDSSTHNTMPFTRRRRSEASDQDFELDSPTHSMMPFTRNRRSEPSAQTFQLDTPTRTTPNAEPSTPTDAQEPLVLPPEPSDEPEIRQRARRVFEGRGRHGPSRRRLEEEK